MASIRFCLRKKGFFQDRFIFMDDEGIYYFWQIYFSEYGATLEIVPFKCEKDRFVEIKTKKVGILIEYLKDRLAEKSEQYIKDFFYNLSSLEFNIPDIFLKKFGERFCNYFLKDQDREFLFLDPYAKHWLIDFDKVAKFSENFLKEPELFPLYIPEVKVVVTKDAKLLKDDKEISINEFWKLYEEYKKSLISIVKKKDKIFKKIENDLTKRYYESLKELKSKNINDFEIDAKVEVYDVLLGYEPIATYYYSKEMFEDKEPYHLNIYGLDMEVSRLCWYVIDSFGLKAINAKFYYWSELRIFDQKFFKF